MFRLENSWYMYFLLLVPLFTLVYLIARHTRKKALERYGDPLLISRLFPDTSRWKPLVRFTVLMAALVFTITGLANPQTGSKIVEAKREGVDVVILFDVSNSMRSIDIKPSRLDRAKQAVSRLIDNMQNDRIAIVVFAGNAFVQLPLTTDYSAAKLFLNTIDPDVMPIQGTAIGRAINKALKSFTIDKGRHKAMIIITDGENHEDDAVGAARDAAKEGYIIHTIGMGSLNGGPIPIQANGGGSDFLRDNEGNIVITKLNDDMLRSIAKSGGGTFVRASDQDPDLSLLINQIGKMDKKSLDSKLFTDYEDRFQYFLAAALLILIAEQFLSDRKNRHISSLIKFVEKY